MRVQTKLTVSNLSKTFNDSQLKVLTDISLHVKENELVSIVGPSGSGKSTLLDCIAGLTAPDDGEIRLGEKPAYMFQDDVMFPWRNVLDNVILPLEIAGVSKSDAIKEAKKLLKEFGLEKFALFYPFMLSGGMRARASLLRTYLCKKDVMLLDEPFSKLDAMTRQSIQQWFLEVLKKQNKTVIFVTHDIDEAIFLSDRIYVLSKRPSTVLAEIVVPIKKPRASDVSITKEFISVKKKILAVLSK